MTTSINTHCCKKLHHSIINAWINKCGSCFFLINRYAYFGCSALTGSHDESCDELHQSRIGILSTPQSLNGNVRKFNRNADQMGYFGARVGENWSFVFKIIIKQLRDSKHAKTWNQSSCVMLPRVGVKPHFDVSCLQTRSSARSRGNAIPQQLEDPNGSSSSTCSVTIDQHSKGNQRTDLIGCLQEG